MCQGLMAFMHEKIRTSVVNKQKLIETFKRDTYLGLTVIKGFGGLQPGRYGIIF